MARRMALIPEELATTYIPKIPDNGLQDIENQILNLLHDAKYPDDAKAKLLSQLLLKYQHVANEPKPPLRVSITEPNEIIQNEFSKSDIKEDSVFRDIILSVPSNFQKFIPPIVEKLKTRNYFWNEYGELVKDNEIVKNTNVIDLFSYLMRNLKKGYEPNGFSVFWKGINEIKIPSRWIGNQKRPTLSYGINDLWQCDLVDLQHLARYNNGFKYLLTIIDVFSKYAYVIPLKNKTSVAVKNAFEKLLQRVKPKNIQSDKGKEFYNTFLQSLFKSYSMNHYSSHGDHKASIIERFNRTLKTKMFRVFTYRKSYKYEDILQSLVKSYNDSVHRSIGMAPSKVTPDLEPQIFKKLYGYILKNEKVTLSKGDLVRISKANKSFRRGYLPGWSEEVFTVSKIYPSHPTTFELQDLKLETIKGRFYADELQKISKRSDDYWHVEKVLKTKGRGSRKEYYVKWKGFDNRFNSWVKATWMK
ncbi:putative uncharacterized transposon-derived protein F54H12.3 [Nephila pilipes]|uniref:Uncharacterized transposon-derived protein F54H12.3 n=1 Tax=Nephila pilipes TaxID=299642 RepID=A0A8X6ID20_NEPPI|nr:putative uncharacterized transposon-derived protein F54H12.3 [Nephila pilipes]